MPAKILFVIGDLRLGGTEQHLLHLLPALNAQEIQPEVFTLFGRHGLADELVAKGIPVHSAFAGERFFQRRRLGRFLLTLVAAFSFLRFLRRRRPDIVHFFLPIPYVIGASCGLLAGQKTMVMSRRSLNHYQRQYQLLAPLEKFLHRRMRSILGNSAAVVAELEQEGVPQQNLKLIYNGVSIPAAAGQRVRLRQDLKITKDALVLICVANLIPYKGHGDLLAALAGIRDKLPQPWQLLLVGRDAGRRQDLEAMCHRAQLNEKVHFLGERRDTQELLGAADIGILCSHQEGFSNSVLEGMAAGLPMIVTAVGGNAEAVQAGISGLVVPPHHPEQLGLAILQLAENKELRTTLGQTARRRVEQHFTMEGCVAAYEALYRQLAKQS